MGRLKYVIGFLALIATLNMSETKVALAAPPANDLFASATTITTSSYTTTINTTDATEGGDDPIFPCPADSPHQRFNTVWWKYTPTKAGYITVSTIGSETGYDTNLGIWTGSPGSLVNRACDQDSGGNLTSKTTLKVWADVPYYIEVAGILSNDAGTLKLNFRFATHPFADVPVAGKEWMEPWISLFYEHGLTTGCGPDATGQLKYCPEAQVKRADMAVFIVRAEHLGSLPYNPPDQSGTFDDMPVAGKEWMEEWVEEFYDLGITTGCGANPLIFCPEYLVTRAEMAVFLLRAIQSGSYVPPPASDYFADVPVTNKEWMMPWIDEFYRRGITTGCWVNPLGYCPENAVTRAEMAVFINRAYANMPNP